MAELAIKNVPDLIYMRLQEQAKNHGCSVDAEALNCLALFFSANGRKAEQTLAAIRQSRSRLGRIHLTDADLEAARNEARS